MQAQALTVVITLEVYPVHGYLLFTVIHWLKVWTNGAAYPIWCVHLSNCAPSFYAANPIQSLKWSRFWGATLLCFSLLPLTFYHLLGLDLKWCDDYGLASFCVAWKICFNKSEALPRSVTRHQCGISALVFQTSFRGINQCWCREMTAIFSGLEMLVPRALFNNRELKQRRRRRQRERQKNNRFRLTKQQLCTCITLFCTFICHHCTTTTWKCRLFSRFVEDVIARLRLSWTSIQSFRIQLQKKLPTFYELKEME